MIRRDHDGVYSLMFFGLGLAHTALFLWALALWRETRMPALLLTLPPVFFFAWDDFRIAAGSVVGFGDTLYALSWPGYWAHWLFGSWLIIASGSILRRAGFAFFGSRVVMASFCVLATALTLQDLPQFWTRELHPLCEFDLIRYGISVNEQARCSAEQPSVAAQIPITPIIASLVALAAGVILWRRRKIAWLALGSLGMWMTALPIFSRHHLEYLGEALIEAGVIASIWTLTRPQHPRAS